MTEAATTEAAWSGWPLLATLPALPRPTGRVVVVSAHPDDEVLGAGGLIASLVPTSASLAFVCVTDGEASHPAAPRRRSADLATLRSAELVDALQVLGVTSPEITRLGLPDAAVADHADRMHAGIAECTKGADLVICPASFDGHSDHVAVGTATAQVCFGRVPVLEMPIWVWHWTAPGDPRVPWDRARRFDLSVDEARSKAAALARFSTQVRPWPPEGGTGTTMLSPAVLEHFTRSYEVFFT